jgi:hypothetical protein
MCLLLGTSAAINAQTLPGYATGLREPQGGQPPLGAKLSVKDLDEQVAYQRAFEAVIWSQPAVGIYGIRKGMFALGMKDNDIMAMSKPSTARHEFLTANNATPYVIANGDLKNGPVVLEVPPASDKGVLYGQVVDAWQETIADVGPSGDDKGKGGKYLFLPPGYDKPVPSGYIAAPSQSFRIAFAFRSIRLPGMSDSDAHAYAQRLKMYPLSEAANPKPTRFVDGWPDRLSTLPYYDFRYFQDLYDIVTYEPVRPRDKVMMGMLPSIGIERGKPFDPSPKVKAAMERAVVDAYFYMQDRIMKVQSKNLFWPERHWSYFFLLDPAGGVTWDTPDGLFIDNRSDMFHPGTYYPKTIPPQPATAYLCALADDHGRPLDARRTYKLHVPKDIPVKQFWSLIAYDVATWAFIYNPLERVGLTTYDVPNMRTNSDGSVDIYFGPKAPAGLESNWIPTQGKRVMPVMRFYGGTEAFWNKSFKLPDPQLVQ